MYFWSPRSPSTSPFRQQFSVMIIIIVSPYCIQSHSHLCSKNREGSCGFGNHCWGRAWNYAKNTWPHRSLKTGRVRGIPPSTDRTWHSA